MTQRDKMAALRAEVEALRAEVALLRSQQAAHVCAQPQMQVVPSLPPCTCGTSMGCRAHPYPRSNIWCGPAQYGTTPYWQNNACARGDVPLTITIPADRQISFTRDLMCGAGVGVPQTFILNN